MHPDDTDGTKTDASSGHTGEGVAKRDRISRRGLLAAAAASAGGAVLARLPGDASAQTAQHAAKAAAAAAPAPPPSPAAGFDLASVPADPSRFAGPPTSALGARSPFETPARTPVGYGHRIVAIRRCTSSPER